VVSVGVEIINAKELSSYMCCTKYWTSFKQRHLNMILELVLPILKLSFI
jgi:dimeric dUTPase (all-alpha-NTP-PPase superfamily)